jgi:hypothetical protein
MKEMPSKGGHLAMVIIGFFLGILWGILAISPYRKMSAAIDAGGEAAAWENPKKVKTFFWIGVAVNVLFIIIRVAGNM